MEAKINIAEILKDKPKGTKLYADAFGELSLDGVGSNTDEIIFTKTKVNTSCCFYNDGKYSKHGEPILVPSKEMRDWRKFDWKKGDVLVSNDSDSHIIFKGFSKDDYTIFEGKHWISVSKKRHISCLNTQNTQNYHIEYNKEVAQTYINTIEERFGGKLNRETLEIEKAQPEFKDGDILCVIDNSNDYHYILIYEGQDDKDIHRYVTMFENNSLNMTKGSYLTKPKDYSMRYATDEEKQQLFDTLANVGKAWDSDKKAVVDLKPKWTPKPFDRVITRLSDDSIWTANIFSHIDRHGKYVTIGCLIGYHHCIPYNEETAKLIGTTNNWEG